jgi:hypothetical protein
MEDDGGIMEELNYRWKDDNENNNIICQFYEKTPTC